MGVGVGVGAYAERPKHASSHNLPGLISAAHLAALYCRAAGLSNDHVQQVLPKMVEAGQGTIIFTGATAALRGGKNFAMLAVPKFALRGLSQCIAREFQPQVPTAKFMSLPSTDETLTPPPPPLISKLQICVAEYSVSLAVISFACCCGFYSLAVPAVALLCSCMDVWRTGSFVGPHFVSLPARCKSLLHQPG